MFSCTMLNITGDITISWDNSTSEEIKNWIENKLNSGHSFFIIEKKCFGLINKKKEVKKVSDLLNKKGTIKLSKEQEKTFLKTETKISFSADKEVEKMVKNNIVSAKRINFNNTTTTKAISTVKEIVSSNTICIKPMMGG